MTNDYESDALLSEYLLLHYGDEDDGMPYAFGPRDALDFPQRCVDELLQKDLLPADATALDVGCAVGRSALALSEHCESVIGLDLSQRFVDTAQVMVDQGHVDHWIAEEGHVRTPRRFSVPAACNRERVSFRVADAMALPQDLGQYDVVMMANLVCRTPDPARCLREGMARVKPGGQLLLTTPYTWLETFTAPDAWLGAQDDAAPRGWDGVSSILSTASTLRHRQDMPFCIREHARKFQWSVADASVWVKHDA
jgi:putative 4-mercaptohistidine N1-methyltranferase